MFFNELFNTLRHTSPYPSGFYIFYQSVEEIIPVYSLNSSMAIRA